MTPERFAGTARLSRLVLRRDRIQLAVWLTALTLVQYVSATSVLGLYPTAADLDSVARNSATNIVSLVSNGLVSGASGGAVVASQTLLVTATAAALMSTFLVVRHTRQNEETGRTELLTASAVGRYAPLTAVLTVSIGANILLAVLNAAGLGAAGLPVAGSLVLGFAAGATGIAFAGVAAVAAQLTDGARAANGLAGAVIGVAFLLRAFGDARSSTTEDGLRVESGWPSWISPIGWAQQTRPYDDNAVWLLFALCASGAVAALAAFWITDRRDIGSGLLATRPGSARAAPWMRRPVGLAWRLHRGTLVGWALGIAIVGLAYGAVANDIDDLIGTSGQAADVFTQLGGGGALVDAYFATVLNIVGIATAAYAVASVLRLRSEEGAGRLEPVLGVPVSRTTWILAHILVTVAGVVVLQLLAGATIGLGSGLTGGEIAVSLTRLTGSAAVFTPAVLVVAAVAVFLFGTVPHHATALAWTVFATCLCIGTIGRLLGLPQSVLNLSPFTHIPAVPAATATPGPLVLLTAIAVATTAGGIVAFGRRDVVT